MGVRLLSLLYGSALEQVSSCENNKFEIIDVTGMDREHLEFLGTQDNKVEIILQWIQQLVVNKHNDGILNEASPILSRVFQELSRGIVNFKNARKIAELPFPFPYAQLLSVALLIQWFMN